ncbi:Lrp/AsnC family transcriptional regulator [Halocatena halophila]|uniref:Lrp/AsnC family transcriptional regulator n=1 Tax=Halocatena halophila TaxID=2814576 RepID=UPI002ED06771
MDARTELLGLLRENARYSISDLARLTDLPEATIEATIADLEDEGVLRGYQAVVDWGQYDSEPVRANVELNVALDHETGYDDIATRLAKFEEIRALRLVSGDYDFELEIEADSMSAVSRFISEQVAPVPEVTQTVTHYVMESYKENGVVFDDGHDDDRLSVTP